MLANHLQFLERLLHGDCARACRAIINDIKTHSSVSVAKKSKEDVRHTSNLFNGTIKLPNSAFLISKTKKLILPYLYIFCLTYDFLLCYFTYQNLKKSLNHFLRFVPENCLIFFTSFFFFTKNYKYIYVVLK